MSDETNVTDEYKELIKSEEARRKFILERLPYMTLMNDYFFAYFMRDNPECMQMTLQTICGDSAISVEKVIIQDTISNFGAHGARFDASVWSRSGVRYSMEIENDKYRASELRLRFYAGTQDSHLLNSGEDYGSLPNAYNIIVTRDDFRGKGKPIYYVRRCWVKSMTEIGDNPQFFEDGHYILYVNGSYRSNDKNDAMSNLMHDFFCDDPEKMRNPILKKHMKAIKGTERGMMDMSNVLAAVLQKNPTFFETVFSDAEKAKQRAIGRKEGYVDSYNEGRDDMANKFLMSAIKQKTERTTIMQFAQNMNIPETYVNEFLSQHGYVN